MNGIDISESNGEINWEAVVDDGIEFVIIRLGYGNRHLDSSFYDNVQQAQDHGLKIGIYYYSYALGADEAAAEGVFCVEILNDIGLKPDMGVWFDMEDADGYKEARGMPDIQTITDMCMAFVNKMNEAGFYCGVYSCLDWLDNMMDRSQFPDYVPIWNAQINGLDDIHGLMWQWTFNHNIDGKEFDADIYYD